MQNALEFHEAKWNSLTLIAKTKGVLDLRIDWVPSHKDFTLNENANEHAKRVTRGNPTRGNTLPKFLKKTLSYSISTICQNLKLKTKWRWTQCWKMSPRYLKICTINKTTPSDIWLKLVANLAHTQASLMFQLCSSHIGLNKHLHHIKHANRPECPNYNNRSIETIHLNATTIAKNDT